MKALFLLAFVIIATKSFSQLRLGGVFVQSRQKIEETTASEKSTYVKGFTNNIPGPVIRDFSLRYPDAENISWYVNDKEINGHFSYDNQEFKVAYKKDGLFLYERTSYDGSKLNQAARDFLEKETGFALPVKYVTQVTREQEEVFEVSIEDEKRWHIYRFGRKLDGPFVLVEKTSFKKG